MVARDCSECGSFGKCEIDDEKCEYTNFNYEDDCEKHRDKKHHDDFSSMHHMISLTTNIAMGNFGSHGGHGFGGFGGGHFGGGGSGGGF
jgi:hypothetical protein